MALVPEHQHHRHHPTEDDRREHEYADESERPKNNIGEGRLMRRFMRNGDDDDVRRRRLHNLGDLPAGQAQLDQGPD
jgi:hypothetical protein